jgi:hypothetical protein
MEPPDGNESDASVDSADYPQGARAPRLSVEVGMVSFLRLQLSTHRAY